MTETQQRFLRAIAERVSRDQVVEVHLFPAIRQGGVETGVAVVAEQPRREETALMPVGPEPMLDARTEPMGSDPDASAAPSDSSSDTSEDAPAVRAIADVASSAHDAATDEAATPGGVVTAAEVTDDLAADALGAGEIDADIDDEDGDADARAATAARAQARLTVHTARYRLTLKGVDRGKWEVDVVAEADAPLAAVDAVVRGVQRRAGEGAEPDRLSADAFREALDAPLSTLER